MSIDPLLQLLRRQARYSHQELAELLSLTESEVGERLSAWEKNGTILGYQAVSGDFDSLTLDGIGCTAAVADSWTCSNLPANSHLDEVFANGHLNLVLRADSVSSDVPEPGALGLLATALFPLLRRRRRYA